MHTSESTSAQRADFASHCGLWFRGNQGAHSGQTVGDGLFSIHGAAVTAAEAITPLWVLAVRTKTIKA